MAYKGTTPTYQIPYPTDADVLEFQEEENKARIIENQLYGANSYLYSAIFYEGVYSIIDNGDGTYDVSINNVGGRPTLSGLIEATYFEYPDTFYWRNLESGKNYYLYVIGLTDLSLYPEQIESVSSESYIDLYSHTLCAFVNLTSLTIDVRPDGKIYANDIAQHPFFTVNPHGTDITQQDLEIVGDLFFNGNDFNVNLESGKSISITGSSGSSRSIIEIINEGTGPDIESFQAMKLKDIYGEFYLSSLGNSSFLTEDQSIVGSINELANVITGGVGQGSNGSVQYNDNGNVGGDDTFIYSPEEEKLTVTNLEILGNIDGVDALDVDAVSLPTGDIEYGDIIYFDGLNWQKLDAGKKGQILQTQGTEGAPIWINDPLSSIEIVNFELDDADPVEEVGLFSSIKALRFLGTQFSNSTVWFSFNLPIQWDLNNIELGFRIKYNITSNPNISTDTVALDYSYIIVEDGDTPDFTSPTNSGTEIVYLDGIIGNSVNYKDLTSMKVENSDLTGKSSVLVIFKLTRNINGSPVGYTDYEDSFDLISLETYKEYVS